MCAFAAGQRRLQVVGVQQREERLGRVLDLVIRVSGELLAARREINVAGQHVPVPKSVVAPDDREIEAFLAEPQGVLEFLAFAQHPP